MQNYSFLISVYVKDSATYLEESLKSMINQSVPPNEVVLIKDGPLTPMLDEMIEKYNSLNPNLFRIIQLKNNVGLGNALNIGLKACKNNLVARMDADDISFLDRCEKQLHAFEKEPKLSICGGQTCEFIDSIDRIVSHRIVPVSYSDIIKFSKRRSPFNHPTVMYKREDILGLGGYPSSNRKEDLDLFLLALSKGFYAINLSDCVLYYRTSVDNYLRRKDKNNCKEFVRIIKKYYKLGYCGFNDFLIVSIAQYLFMCMPLVLVKFFDKMLLRK